MIIHALYILKIYFQVVRIDFALNHLIKLKYFVTADSAQAITFAGLYYEFNFKNQSFVSQTHINYYFHINKTLLKYSLKF